MQLSDQVLKEIVGKVIESLKGEELGGVSQKDPSGIVNVKASTVRPEPVDTGNPGDKVYVTDIISTQESSRLGCGIMAIDQSTVECNLKHDEIDYIIDGAVEIIIDGRVIQAEKGDVVFIPKNTAIQFKAQEYVRFMYVVSTTDGQE